MAFTCRKTHGDMIAALVAANNQRLVDGISTSFHLDRTATTSRADYQNPTITRLTVTVANATNSATGVTLVNNVLDVLNVHFVDAIAHNSAVSAALTDADATNEATAITLANTIKAAYGVHLSASNVHYTNDSTNTVSAANATNEATLVTLVNELKTDLNAHMLSAPSGAYIDLVPA